jgi:hypothetical protein
MLNINEEDLKAAIVEKAVDELMTGDHDLSGMVATELKKRIDKIFLANVDTQIQNAIQDAVSNSFEREYVKVSAWGEPEGKPTSIKKELEKTVGAYWTAKVDPRTGKASDSTYNSVTRAEYLMTQVCAEDFSKGMHSAVLSVTGALKDGLRNQLAQQMDQMLSELFRVKSLQDQGKVEKPY